MTTPQAVEQSQEVKSEFVADGPFLAASVDAWPSFDDDNAPEREMDDYLDRLEEEEKNLPDSSFDPWTEEEKIDILKTIFCKRLEAKGVSEEDRFKCWESLDDPGAWGSYLHQVDPKKYHGDYAVVCIHNLPIDEDCTQCIDIEAKREPVVPIIKPPIITIQKLGKSKKPSKQASAEKKNPGLSLDAESIKKTDKRTKANRPERYRCFSITINNPCPDDEDLFNDPGRIKYYVYQFEIAPITKTPHIQACVYYYEPITWKNATKRWPGAHVEEARDVTACIKYCKKEDSRDPAPNSGPFEFGIMPEQGKRTDLEALALDIREGKKNPGQLADEYPVLYLKYPKGIQTLMDFRYKPRTQAPYVVWLWGLKNTGKSFYARSRHQPNIDKLYEKDGTMWWDKYIQQEAILIDDFDAARWPFRDFLRLLDEGIYQGQYKGGYIYINSPTIYITCEFHPNECYLKGNTYDQVYRRLNKIIQKTKSYEGPNRKVQIEVVDED